MTTGRPYRQEYFNDERQAFIEKFINLEWVDSYHFYCARILFATDNKPEIAYVFWYLRSNFHKYFGLNADNPVVELLWNEMTKDLNLSELKDTK